jgi:hypothetical protein
MIHRPLLSPERNLGANGTEARRCRTSYLMMDRSGLRGVSNQLPLHVSGGLGLFDQTTGNP